MTFIQSQLWTWNAKHRTRLQSLICLRYLLWTKEVCRALDSVNLIFSFFDLFSCWFSLSKFPIFIVLVVSTVQDFYFEFLRDLIFRFLKIALILPSPEFLNFQFGNFNIFQFSVFRRICSIIIQFIHDTFLLVGVWFSIMSITFQIS